MDWSTKWWLGMGAITVLALIGCVLVAHPDDRARTALSYAGTYLVIAVPCLAMMWLGWWPR
jgi:hypothetical protein